ncbi:MAG: ABC transporter substrate-binding protein, partial [Chloroflexi bacterium]|nr:ABC transporter substrate-binding protein [Chloroflexota bacterium]
LTLREPASQLLGVLALPAFSMVSPNAITAGNLATSPVGTGPFKFDSWAAGDRIHLLANAAYWNGAPTLTKATILFLVDEGERMAALLDGRAQASGDITPRNAMTLTNGTGLSLFWMPANAIGYMGINRNHAPLGNDLVREAIAHAIDKQALLRDYYNPGDQAARALLTPGLWGNDPAMEDYSYDPLLAQSLLVQAGYPNGFEIELGYRNVYRTYLPDAPETSEAIADYLRAVGITVTVQEYAPGDFITQMDAGELDLFMIGWGLDYPHPANVFAPLFCDGSMAYGNEDTALCDQVEAAKAVYDLGQQDIAYQWATHRVRDTLPLIPLTHARIALVVDEDFPHLHFGLQGALELGEVVYAPHQVYLPVIE